MKKKIKEKNCQDFQDKKNEKKTQKKANTGLKRFKEKLTKWGPRCVVLPSFPSFGVGLCSPSRLLGRADWFSFSGLVLPFFLSFWWDYFSPVFCWVVLLGPLLVGGGVASCFACFVSSSSFGRCCFSNLLSGGPAFLLILLVGLPSITSSGWSCFFPSSEWWRCLVSFFFGWCCFSTLRCCLPSPPLGGPRSPPPLLGWCCLPFPPLGGVALPLSFCVVLPSFPSFGVGLRSSSLQLGPALSPPPLLGGVAFPISFQVVLPSFSSFWWGCLPSPPLGGATFPIF